MAGKKSQGLHYSPFGNLLPLQLRHLQKFAPQKFHLFHSNSGSRANPLSHHRSERTDVRGYCGYEISGLGARSFDELLVKFRVDAFGCKQLLVRAAFDYSALIHDEHQIGFANGA